VEDCYYGCGELAAVSDVEMGVKLIRERIARKEKGPDVGRKGGIRFSHFSISVMQSWNSRMCLRSPLALRAPSWAPLSERVPSDAACSSC
jgi:hypothetical protein